MWSIVFGGSGVELRAVLEPLEPVVISGHLSPLSMGRQFGEVCECV